MSLPGYTKISQDINEDEQPDQATTYPPPSPPSSSSAQPLPPSSARLILPPHLATFILDGRFMLFSEKTAICTRARNRLETIEHLESVFPQLLNRPTSSIQFEIDTGFNNSEGKHQANWAAVSDAVWHDAMVETKPDTIRVSIDVTSAEQTRQWVLGVVAFSSPFWIVGLIFLVLWLCGVDISN